MFSVNFGKLSREFYLKDIIICHGKHSRLGYDLLVPTKLNDRVISPFREGFIFLRNFAAAKFRENKSLTKISDFTVLSLPRDVRGWAMI